MVSFAQERIKDGKVTDQTTRELIRQLLDGLVIWAYRLEQGTEQQEELLKRAI